MQNDDLFSNDTRFQPLAARMRPRTAASYIGQQHLLGADKPLAKTLASGRIHSMILWGPPGTGKTTLAEMIAEHGNAHIERVSAVTAGVKDIRQAIQTAQSVATSDGKQTVMFVDEVHRFNKSQQDAFLPFIEDGTIVFIGATTENPAFELNNALLSRARVYVLKSLTTEELKQVVHQALKEDAVLSQQSWEITLEALELLVDAAQGDARRALNSIELATDFAENFSLDVACVKQALGEKVAQYDKNGDHFYDLISAFHKSVRGSAPDAALYWYARMLAAGCDPLYVARRLLAIVSEDIGNADPRAMQVALNAWDIFQRVGPAEGERAIAQATVYCACAAKSNAVYNAFNQAKAMVKAESHLPVPEHLRNAPTDLHKDLGFGDGYRYAHNESENYAAGECYFPQQLQDTQLYIPTDNGLEKKIKQKLSYLAARDSQSEQKRYKK